MASLMASLHHLGRSSACLGSWSPCYLLNKRGGGRVSSQRMDRKYFWSRSIAEAGDGAQVADVSPLSTKVAANSELRTPHSGYHFDGSKRRFFEGWYFKVSIPKEKQSFAWMYSMEDPAFNHHPSGLEKFIYGPRFPSVGAQVLGADDQYLFQYTEDPRLFWGSRHELSLGNTFTTKNGQSPPLSVTEPVEFWSKVEEGFQVTSSLHQGYLQHDCSKPSYAKTVDNVRWEYVTQPVYGWGNTTSKQKATAGWLAVLPVFEPHWQICMSGGLSTGWIQWGDRRFEFENAPSYAEKNWGGSFPQKWFWVQCNVFEGVSGEVALTAAGGRRSLPIFPGLYEDVAMVGVHYDGKLYEFVPWNGPVEWEISSWGLWHMRAHTTLYEVELKGTTSAPGTTLRAPTAEAGLAPFCKDTFNGNLKLRIWKKTVNGGRGKEILNVTSDMAAMEVGGGPWYGTWSKRSESSEILKPILGASLDVESIFSESSFLKPAGL
eukprot:c17636_g1_i1 orf=219-1685(+)